MMMAHQKEIVTFEDMAGVFLELENRQNVASGRGYIYCKELGNVIVSDKISPDPYGKWFRFSCHWDEKSLVCTKVCSDIKQIDRTYGSFKTGAEVRNVQSELGCEKECREDGRTIAKFTGSGMVLQVAENFMYLWHCYVGIILHVNESDVSLIDCFAPLQPVSFKAVALDCLNRFVSFSAISVRAHSQYRPQSLFFAQNVKIVNVNNHFVARTKDFKNIVLLDENFSLLQTEPESKALWNIAYFQVFTKDKKIVYLSAFLTDEEFYNETFDNIIHKRGSDDFYEYANGQSSCGEDDGYRFFQNLKIWDIDGESMDWYTSHEPHDEIIESPETSNSCLSLEKIADHQIPQPCIVKEPERETVVEIPSQEEKVEEIKIPEATTFPTVTREKELIHPIAPTPPIMKDSSENKTQIVEKVKAPTTARNSMKSLFFSKPSEKSVNLLRNKSSGNETQVNISPKTTTNQTLNYSLQDSDEQTISRDETSFLNNPSLIKENIEDANLDRLNKQLRAISCVVRTGYKSYNKGVIEKEDIEPAPNNANLDNRESSPDVHPRSSNNGIAPLKSNFNRSQEDQGRINTSIESVPVLPSSSSSAQNEDFRKAPKTNHVEPTKKSNWTEKRKEDFPKALNRFKTDDVNAERFSEQKYLNLPKRMINENSIEFVERVWGKLDTSENTTLRLVLFSIATDSPARCAVRAFSRDIVLLLMHIVYSPEEPFFVYDLQRSRVNLREIEDYDPFFILIYTERHIFDIICAEQSLWNYIIQALPFIRDLPLPNI